MGNISNTDTTQVTQNTRASNLGVVDRHPRNSTDPNMLRSHRHRNRKQRKDSNFVRCPVCFDEKICMKLRSCGHHLCQECLGETIRAYLKDITKYPMTCILPKCGKVLHDEDVKHALGEKDKADIEDTKEESETHELSEYEIYGKFNVLCALPDQEREQCTKCEMVFFKPSEAQEHFFWNPSSTQCKNHLYCGNKALRFYHAKINCYMCGDVFCKTCCQYQIPLSITNPQIIRKHLTEQKMKKSKPSIFNLTIPGITSTIPQADIEYDVTLTAEEMEEAEMMSVMCCQMCWLSYYRTFCQYCKHEFCRQCRQDWDSHIGKTVCKITNKSAKGRDAALLKKEKEEKKNEALNEEFFKDMGYRKCPGCGIVVGKTEGCNHMTHHSCPDPNDGDDTHFCYCCGEKLFGKYHKQEKDGTCHFPNTLFGPCRKTG